MPNQINKYLNLVITDFFDSDKIGNIRYKINNTQIAICNDAGLIAYKIIKKATKANIAKNNFIENIKLFHHHNEA